jgi:hypothetical protein
MIRIVRSETTERNSFGTGMEQSYERVMQHRHAFMLQLRTHWILEVEELLMRYDEDSKKTDDAPNPAARREDRVGLPSGIEMYVKAMLRMPMTYTRYPTYLHSLRAMHSSGSQGGTSEEDQWRSKMSEIGVTVAAQIESGSLAEQQTRTDKQLAKIGDDLVTVAAQIESNSLDRAVKSLAERQTRTDEQLAKIGKDLTGIKDQMAQLITMVTETAKRAT